MRITELDENGVKVFTLEGRIDTQGAVDLDLALQAAVSAGQHNMVLEMAAVTYICSSGLRTLADVLTKNKDEGGDLKLAALSRKVLRVFRIIGFEKFFSLYDSVDEALNAFGD